MNSRVRHLNVEIAELCHCGMCVRMYVCMCVCVVEREFAVMYSSNQMME